MLVECGFVRATAGDGTEWTFQPSLARIAALGDPHQVVALYARLFGPDAQAAATDVLAGLCDQDDPTPLIGGIEIDAEDPEAPARPIVGMMPPGEQIIIARHLMQHGMVGIAKPGGTGAAEGGYTDRFDASEFIAAARVHLGLSSADAEALSMTELQRMLEMKFPTPDNYAGRGYAPTADEYDAAMAHFDAMEAARG